MKHFNFALAMMLFANVSVAEVYRTVTPDGQVVYTDNATQYQGDATQLVILDNVQNAQQFQHPQTQPVHTSTADTIVPNQQNVTPAGFYRLNIVVPDEKMVYRRPNDIVVQVESTPALQRGDRFVYRINGKHIATTQDNEYKISSMDYMPERYTLTVQIENGKGVVINEQSQDFQLLANNFATRQKRQAEAEAKAIQEAYDKLPWYKKLTYNINIGEKRK